MASATASRGSSLLGLHEFSLMSRIQAGEIKSTRSRSGEMLIPESELERLAPNVSTAPRVDLETGPVPISDEKLGIKKAFGGLTQNGQYISRPIHCAWIRRPVLHWRDGKLSRGSPGHSVRT